MKYVLISLLFCSVFVACTLENPKTPNANVLQSYPAETQVIPLDSMEKPKVILVDESKLKKIPVGKPRIVAANTNVYPAGQPKVVLAGKPRILTPGKDGFPLPKKVLAKGRKVKAEMPEMVVAKDAYVNDYNPYSFSRFTELQGMQDARINYLMQDHTGNLWLGTQSGLSKYDGNFFYNFHFTEKTNWASRSVSVIVEDHEGNIWFNTVDGIKYKFDGKYFTVFTEKLSPGTDIIGAVLKDHLNNLWFGIDDYVTSNVGGIIKYDGENFIYFKWPGNSACNIYSIVEDNAGNLWFGTSLGAIRFDGKSFAQFTDKEGLIDNDVNIFKDHAGNLWFGTLYGACKYDGKYFTQYTEKNGLLRSSVSFIMEDPTNKILFGHIYGISGDEFSNGLSIFDGKSFTHLTEKEGLNFGGLSCMLKDSANNIWLGDIMGIGGLTKYAGNSFTHFTKKEGFPIFSVVSILKDSAGDLWFGTNGNGVIKYDGKSFIQFTKKEGLIGNYIRQIIEDNSGNIWFGSTEGACKYDGRSFTHFTKKDGLISNPVERILFDHSDNIWFATYKGLCKYDGKSFTLYTKPHGFGSISFNTVFEDHLKNLWLGTESDGKNGGAKIIKYDGKSFTHFKVKGGPTFESVYSILEDHSGNIWFGTDAGLIEYNGKTFTHFTKKEGLSNNIIKSILEDHTGNLWFGTEKGLSLFSKEKQKEFTKKAKFSGYIESNIFFKNYGYEDGFFSLACMNNSIFEAEDGTIWIGTFNDVTAFHPHKINNNKAPNIQVNKLQLYNEDIPWSLLEDKQDSTLTLGNGVPMRNYHFVGTSKWYGLPEHLSLAYNNNFLTFHFIGITLDQPKQVRYRYKLEGQDENWSAISERNEAPYGNLPPGTYTFKVKAMNSTGLWSAPIAYRFTIRPPWWQSWWAYTIYLLLLGFAGWRLYYFLKQRTIKKEREKTLARELEQAKKIEEAYTQLQSTQAQLIQSEKLASLGELTAGIAHEIQNPLNFVNNFAEISVDMAEELREEIKKPEIDKGLIEELATDLALNQEKINHHGKRASSIVKGMLEHSRVATSRDAINRVSTDLNALADEYLRLAYHGLRAKDSSFNATMETHFDPDLPRVEVIPQDIGRVLLNLINNAFYAVNEKAKQGIDGYSPVVTVSTRKLTDAIEISIQDNGNGIPDAIKDKIFQPFFTTKPTGQGTGLGLSLAYDIVTKGHGGTLGVSSVPNEGTEFVIRLPFNADLYS